MIELLKQLRRIPVRFLVRQGIAAPFVWMARWLVTLVGGENATGPTLLALNPARFRGDLEILAQEKDVRVLAMSFDWQCFFYSCFYRDKESCIFDRDLPHIAVNQTLYRKFLHRFLPRFFDALGVDAVIGAAIHYRQDYDIAAVSHSMGIPTLILHREGNLGSRAVRQQFSDRCAISGRFHGTRLLVHNAVQRDILIESGYAVAEQVVVVGSLRMDGFVCRVRAGEFEVPRAKKRVVLFSFGPSTGNLEASPPHWPDNPNDYMLNFCRETHCSVARIARDNPDVEVVIKAKWGGRWVSNVVALLESCDLQHAEILNLTITEDGDAQQLMAESDVVVAFGSTTLLESALMGRATILPCFAEAASERMAESVFYHDDFNCFDIATSSSELEQIIMKRLSGFVATQALTERRIALFEKYVSSWDAKAVGIMYGELTSAIERMRRVPISSNSLPVGPSTR